MPRGRSRHQVMDPAWKVMNPASFSATFIVLIFACLCKGLQSQNSAYHLAVPSPVSVQRGLCVHIPCSFTYDQRDRTSHETLYGYWFQKRSGYTQNILVATNDHRKTLYSSVQNRFQLTGEVEEGNCSFSILDAESQDDGEYYFRIEDNLLKYSYVANIHRSHTLLRIFVTEVKEKPQIRNSSVVLSGKEAVFTCSVPGPCTKIWPSVRWATTLTGLKSDVWSLQHSNGSWTYGSNFTFTPSLNDQGEWLTCQFWYPNIREYVKNTIRIDVADPPKTVEISTNATNHGHLVFCSPDSAVAREGESISLQCEAESRPEPTLSWMKGNKTLSSTRQGKEHVLLLSEIRPEDAGEYQCQAETPYGSARKILHLCVLYPPRRVAFSVSRASRRDQALIQDTYTHMANGSQLTVQEGDSLQLLCMAPSYPPAETNWVKGSRTLEHHSPSPETWLELTNLTVEDAGHYACQAENSLGSVQGIVQLSITYGPRLSSNRSRSTCWQEDNSLHCNCSLNSWPPLQIQWEVNGQPLSANSSEGGPQVTSWSQENEFTSSLSWATENLDESHNVICRGANHLGTYTLHFLVSPPTKSNHGSLAGAGVCGALVAVILCVLCLILIKFYKQRKEKASSKSGDVEVLNSANGGLQRANDGSLIYSNVSPLGQKSPRANQSKAARERISPLSPRVPSLSITEPEDLHYATLEFSKVKAKQASVPEELVEYSAVKQI